MKTEDLILSFGDVSPEFLEESEISVSKKRKPILKIALIAAVIGALAITSVAVGIKHIFGIELMQTHKSLILQEDSLSASADVFLDVKMGRNAPATLEEHYLPILSAEGWVTKECSANRFSSRFSCEKGEDYIIFQQLAAPDYRGQYTIDTVDLGYGAAYESKEESIGGVDVFTVTVEPSQNHLDGGRHKYYWSDGRYLFIMEVNYGMAEPLRKEIFESISTVDIEDYLQDPAETVFVPMDRQEITAPMYPTTLPQGWGKESGGLQPDGSYTYYWHPLWEEQTMSVIEFVQTMDASYYEQVKIDWAADMDTISQEVEEGFFIYRAPNQTQILWQQDGYYFSLDNAGDTLLSVQELIAIAKSVKA